MPNHLLGDSYRLRQILTNLIGNGIKFTASGHIEIEVILLDKTSATAGTIQFAIKDTGIGICRGALDSLFDRFNQADNSNTRRYGGTGLGLAICKGLVENMGGNIWVKSEQGKGSIFYFTCDLEIQDSHIDQCVLSNKAESKLSDSKKTSILLVEDNGDSQHVIQLLSRKVGWDLTVVENGNHAITTLAAKAFDVVLMDLQMPYMDGYETTRRIRQLDTSKDIPIIALTAHAFEGNRESCLQIGMNDYLTKPVNFKELQQKIKQWMPRVDGIEVINNASLER